MKNKKLAIIDFNDPNKIHYMTNYFIRQSPPTVKGTADNQDRYMLLEIMEDEKGAPSTSYYWTSDSMETLRELAEVYPRWQDYVNYESRDGGEVVEIDHFNIESYKLELSRPMLHAVENAIIEQAQRMRETASLLSEQGDEKGARHQISEAEELEGAALEIAMQIRDLLTPDYLK